MKIIQKIYKNEQYELSADAVDIGSGVAIHSDSKSIENFYLCKEITLIECAESDITDFYENIILTRTFQYVGEKENIKTALTDLLF